MPPYMVGISAYKPPPQRPAPGVRLRIPAEHAQAVGGSELGGRDTDIEPEQIGDGPGGRAGSATRA